MESTKKKWTLLKKVLVVFAALAVLAGGFFAFLLLRYGKAEKIYNEGRFDEAKVIFEKMGSFKSADEMVLRCDYTKALGLLNAGKTDEAKVVFESISEFEDSSDLVLECDYRKASGFLKEKKYDEAKVLFSSIVSYKDCSDLVFQCDYDKATDLLNAKAYDDAKALFNTISDFKNSSDMVLECDFRRGMEKLEGERYDEFMAVMNLVPAYKTYVFYSGWGFDYDEFGNLWKWNGKIELPKEALDIEEKEMGHEFDPFDMYLAFETDMNDYSREEELRAMFESLGDYSDSEKVVKDLTKIIGSKKFYALSFAEAKEEFDKYPDDDDFAFFSKACEMEMIRDLALEGNYKEVGSRLMNIIFDDEFLLEYYGKGSICDNEDFQTLVGGKVVKPKVARQHIVDGVMHQLNLMYMDDDKLGYFFYGICDREDTNYGFIDFSSEGVYISKDLHDKPIKRWE